MRSQTDCLQGGTRALRNAAKVALLAALLACSPPPGKEAGEVSSVGTGTSSTSASAPPCPDRSEERHAYFGDLHIHTGLSADARLFGTVNRPDDAYRFARGETITIRKTNSSEPTVQGRIGRPLDFAAVTDHAENIGTVYLCMTPGSETYDTPACQFVREPLPTDTLANFSEKLGRVFETMYSDDTICGPNRERCRAAVALPWDEIQESANRWNDACEFTAFIGYEYSPTPLGSKLHHNVIFRNENVMKVPISSRDVPSMIEFWKRLRSECKEAETGCDVLSIPHNPNLGNGQMFSLSYAGETDPKEQRALAELRAEIEPVVEIFQHKGDSECRNGLWNVLGGVDEECNNEKFRDWKGNRFEDCRDGQGSGALHGKGCVSRLDYTRYALAAGLAEKRRIGANPHKFGVIGSTDNHEGTAADVDEWVNDGIQRRPESMEPGRKTTGGLAAVWAEENTREAIFQAMRRREIFATSGTRMELRFFGGWDLPEDLCEAPDLVRRGYAAGVPMGGDLDAGDPRAASGTEGPAFVVSALADPGTAEYPGTPLQRIQIIKVWPGEGDALHQAVFEVAGGQNGASVDLATCELRGRGAAGLCGVWRDPEFDPKVGAAYYARAIENPSCRYTAHTCRTMSKNERPTYCEDDTVAMEVRERAWSSPIWVSARR